MLDEACTETTFILIFPLRRATVGIVAGEARGTALGCFVCGE